MRGEQMSSEDHKKVVQRYFLEMWNNKDFDLVNQLVSEEYLHHKPDGSTATGRDTIRGVMKLVFATYPDVQWVIQLIVAENDLVSTYIEGKATHPNPAKFKEVFYHRFKDGVMVEGWVLPLK